MRCWREGCTNEATQRVTYTHGDGGSGTYSDLCDEHLPAEDAEIPLPYTARTVGSIPEPETAEVESGPEQSPARARRQEMVHAALDADESEDEVEEPVG